MAEQSQTKCKKCRKVSDSSGNSRKLLILGGRWLRPLDTGLNTKDRCPFPSRTGDRRAGHGVSVGLMAKIWRTGRGHEFFDLCTLCIEKTVGDLAGDDEFVLTGQGQFEGELHPRAPRRVSGSSPKRQKMQKVSESVGFCRIGGEDVANRSGAVLGGDGATSFVICAFCAWKKYVIFAEQSQFWDKSFVCNAATRVSPQQARVPAPRLERSRCEKAGVVAQGGMWLKLKGKPGCGEL